MTETGKLQSLLFMGWLKIFILVVTMESPMHLKESQGC